MGTPAAVLGDKITATCSAHQIPNPTSGAPQPGPPFPFVAAVTTKCEPKVLIGGKPAVVVGSFGLNVPPHVGLHPSDPCMTPATAEGHRHAGQSDGPVRRQASGAHRFGVHGVLRCARTTGRHGHDGVDRVMADSHRASASPCDSGWS